MKLTVLGSGSKGNCYLLHNDYGECLILEAGVPFREVLRAMKGNLRSIAGCLVTHEHQDHAKYVADFVEHGIRVFMTKGTRDKIIGKLKEGIKKTMLCYGINVFNNYGMGDGYTTFDCVLFRILPFPTVHDAAEPCGFFINNFQTGNIVFATDTAYVPNTFKDVTNIIIECNYDPELLDARTDIPDTLKQRIRESHQSIDTCIEAIRANSQGTLHQAILIHISEGDGDSQTFGQRVQAATGIHTEVATPGAVFTINKHPF